MIITRFDGRPAYLLLQVWDRLSLQSAFRHAGDFTLRLDPSPFADDALAGAPRVAVECKVLR